MAKQFDVIALGELLIDFTENGLSGQGNPLLEANAVSFSSDGAVLVDVEKYDLEMN